MLRLSTVKDEFNFNASEMAIAPSTPIWLPNKWSDRKDEFSSNALAIEAAPSLSLWLCAKN